MSERILQIEDPDTTAIVDFLSAKFLVTIVKEDNRVRIEVQASHGEGSSAWDNHAFEFELPEQIEEEEDDEDESFPFEPLVDLLPEAQGERAAMRDAIEDEPTHDEKEIVTCHHCKRSWCGECDPAPSAQCHYCTGRGHSTAPVERS